MFKLIKKNKLLIYLLLFYLLSSGARLYANFASETVPGLNGGYYPMQVRHLINIGRLVLADFPLVFYLEAGIALLLNLFFQNINQSILISHKLVDSLVPTLIILPAILLAKSLIKKRQFLILIAAIAVFNISLMQFFVGEFTKNAVGNLLVFTSLAVFLWFNKRRSWRRLFILILSLSLAATCHFSSLLLVILFSFVFFAQYLADTKNVKKAVWGTLFFVVLLVAAITYLKATDFERFNRVANLLASPLQIFERPVLGSLLEGQRVVRLINMIHLLFWSFIGITGLYLELAHFAKERGSPRLLFLASSILTILLNNLLTGYAWAERIWHLAYIPGLLCLTRIFVLLKRKKLYAFLTILFMLISLGAGLKLAKQPLLSKNQIADFQVIKDLSLDQDDLFVVEHGYEYWWSWYTQKSFIIPTALANNCPYGENIILLLSNQEASDTYQGDKILFKGLEFSLVSVEADRKIKCKNN